MKKFLDFLKGLPRFFFQDLWRLPLYRYKPLKAIGLRLLRIFTLTGIEFGQDRCTLRATALTLYSLLAIVPLLAICLAVARGFNLQDVLINGIESAIETRCAGNEELERSIKNVFVEINKAAQNTLATTTSYGMPKSDGSPEEKPETLAEEREELKESIGGALDVAKKGLEKTKFGAMAGIGVIILLWTVIKLMSNIEYSFNDIFGGIAPRSFGRKIIDYTAITILLPFLLILSTTMTVFLQTQADMVVEKVPLLATLSPTVHFFIGLTPYLLIWVAFIFLYMFMPNCKVKLVPGLVAGITAGTVFNVVLWFYFYFQIGMAKASAIYGVFAAIPLFIALLQTSWIIVLCGAEFAFAIQNHGYYEPRNLTDHTSLTLWFAIYVRIMGEAARNLIDEKEPQSARQLAFAQGLPVQMAERAVNVLTSAGLLIRLEDRADEPVYLPSVAVESLTVGDVLLKIQRYGDSQCPGLEGEEYKKLIEALQKPTTLVRNL